jgi:hypothetical protein
LAHRFGYKRLVGPIPAGMFVCHHCDNPPCQRPTHWFVGTHADNMADMVAKGRSYSPGMPGEANSRAKLTAPAVLAIRQAYADGARQDDLAAEWGLGQPTIGKIIRGERWGTAGGPITVGAKRRATGLRNVNGKLNPEQVAEIRRIYALGGTSQAAIAARFGVSQASVSSLILAKTHR